MSFSKLGAVFSQLGMVGQSWGLPTPPNGFVYLLGADVAYLLGADGAYLLGVAP